MATSSTASSTRRNLSTRERDTLLRARRILDAWIERQEAAGKTSDNSFPVHDAYEAIFFLDEFIWQTRGM